MEYVQLLMTSPACLLADIRACEEAERTVLPLRVKLAYPVFLRVRSPFRSRSADRYSALRPPAPRYSSFFPTPAHRFAPLI